MKKILLLITLLFSIGTAEAQFSSPNLGLHFNLNDLVFYGGATQAGGAYIVNQDLTLETTDTLSITTNEVIKLGDDIRITIKGTLLINPPDSVKITAVSPANTFHTLRFESSANVSKLKKTIVEYGSGVRVIDAGLEMDSCTVRFNERVAQSGAINVSGSIPVTITNSRIYRNARAGVSTPANGATVIIRNNWFFENGTEPGLYPQINLGPAKAGPLEITGNTIIGINQPTNRSGGIAIANLLGSSAITNFLIAHNTVQQNSYGIAITGTNLDGYIKDNLLEGNKVYPNALISGSGLNFNSTTGMQRVVVARNIVRDNFWGVTIQSGTGVAAGPKPSFGRIGSADSVDVGLNQFYNNYNNGSSGQIWDFYNNTTDSIYAENNIWGTTDTTQIEDHIFHKTDDPNHGFVKYLPIYRKPATGINPAQAQQSLHFYPNPATDLVKLELNGMVLNEKSNLRFYNNLGQEVLNLKPTRNAGTLEVNTSKLPVGLYVYRLENGGKTYSGKLLINR